MPWVKLDTDFWSHPKIVMAGEKLAIKHQRAMCWSAAHGTNGLIPKSIRRQFSIYPTEIERLISLCLWDESDENHWRIHDWNVYNPDAESSKRDRDEWETRRQEMRANARERKRRERAKHADVTQDVTPNVTRTVTPTVTRTSRVTLTRAREYVPSRHVPSLDEDVERDAAEPSPSLGAKVQPTEIDEPASAIGSLVQNALAMSQMNDIPKPTCSHCGKRWRGAGTVCDRCLENEDQT